MAETVLRVRWGKRGEEEMTEQTLEVGVDVLSLALSHSHGAMWDVDIDWVPGDVVPPMVETAEALADRLFNAVIVLYGAAKQLRFDDDETDDALLHQRVLMRAEADLGLDLLAQVEAAIERRASAGRGTTSQEDEGG